MSGRWVNAATWLVVPRPVLPGYECLDCCRLALSAYNRCCLPSVSLASLPQPDE
jgi:hypothetical protein